MAAVSNFGWFLTMVTLCALNVGFTVGIGSPFNAACAVLAGFAALYVLAKLHARAER